MGGKRFPERKKEGGVLLYDPVGHVHFQEGASTIRIYLININAIKGKELQYYIVFVYCIVFYHNTLSKYDSFFICVAIVSGSRLAVISRSRQISNWLVI